MSFLFVRLVCCGERENKSAFVYMPRSLRLFQIVHRLRHRKPDVRREWVAAASNSPANWLEAAPRASTDMFLCI